MKFKKITLTLCFSLLIALLLTYPSESVSFAKDGLLTWFNTMLPTLMPFMILSTLMISLHMTDFLGAPAYCIIMGFLCGFPMGAKVVKDLYQKNALSLNQANDLLGFCNNLGPIFILNFALPTLGVHNRHWCVLGFYGIPLIYGLILRNLHKNEYLKSTLDLPQKQLHNTKLLYHIDDAIQCAISSITILGGYMIFFNLLNIIPYAFSQLNTLMLTIPYFELILPQIRCLIEISGGLASLQGFSPFALCLIPLGGLSCLAQTYSILKETDLSFALYCRHKIIQTAITCLYFMILTFCGISFY